MVKSEPMRVNNREGINLLDLKPERIIEWEDGENGIAILLVPKFRKGILARFLQPRLKRPFHRVHLDEYGTFIWNLCDGTRTVKEVADSLKAVHGEKVEPVYQRAGFFVQSLVRNQFVSLKSDV